MAIKGYYDNPDEATSVNEGDYLGIQQGTTLADMKKVKKQTLFKPTDDAIVELESRATDLEYSDISLNGKIDGLAGTGRTTETVKQNADDIATLNGDDSTEGSVAKTVKDAVDLVKGTGWTDENLVDHESRIGDLETNDTFQDATLGTLKETVLSTKLAVNELERQSQIGNGATLDFSDIGIVPLDARATGRANPTIYGSTVGSDSIQLPARVRSVGKNLFDELKATAEDKDLSPMSFLRDDKTFTVTMNYHGQGIVSDYIPAFLGYVSISAVFQALTGTPNFRYVVYAYDKNKNLLNSGLSLPYSPSYYGGVTGTYSTNAKHELSFQVTEDTVKYIRVKCIGYDYSVVQKFSVSNIQLELGSTATTYEPYTDSTLYIADDSELRSFGATTDLVKVANGVFKKVGNVDEYVLVDENFMSIANDNEIQKVRVNTPENWYGGKAVVAGYSVSGFPYNTESSEGMVYFATNGNYFYFIVPLGTYTTLAEAQADLAGTVIHYRLATPVTTNLTTSGILQAKPNGTVYFEPYYEGSHQTNASSQITLPYEGTIEAVYGYDEDLVEYLLDSSEYSLTGTTLTITDALENEVFYVQMSRSEPLAPEMSVNVINNDQVTLDSEDGKYYQIGFTTTNGVPTVTATEVV